MVLRFVYGAVWAAEGVFTLFAVLFAFIGAQFVGLGLMGEYIGRIYQDARGRPRYFVQEVRGVSLPQPLGRYIEKQTLRSKEMTVGLSLERSLQPVLAHSYFAIGRIGQK